MLQEEQKDFFISYTNADSCWAEWIAWHLENEGYSVILRGWDFHPGANIVLELDRAVTTAQQTIVVLSPHYIHALYTLPEWTVAFKRDTSNEQAPVLPVRVEDCEVEGLLKPLAYIDLVGLQEDDACKSLLDRISGLRPKREPPFPGNPPAIWHVPHERNPLFIGRENVLSYIYQTLHGGTTIAITPSLAVEQKMRSIGKTQTALEYAYRYRNDYTAVCWVQASSTKTFQEEMQALAKELQLQGVERQHPRQILTRLRERLATQADQKSWLFILDDVVHPRVVQNLFPANLKEHVLLTSRERNIATIAQIIELDALKPEEEERISQLSQQFQEVRHLTDQPLSLSLEEMTIGRAQDNKIVLKDDLAVSPYHAVIRRKNDASWIMDLKSLHGTFVNHQRILSLVPYRLEPNDLLRIGKTIFVYSRKEQHLIPPIEKDILKDRSYRETSSVVSPIVIPPHTLQPGQPYPLQIQENDPESGFAIAGLVLGIISLVLFSSGIGIITAIVGIFISIRGRRSISHKEKATAGLVMCIITLGILALILLIIAIIFFAFTSTRQ